MVTNPSKLQARIMNSFLVLMILGGLIPVAAAALNELTSEIIRDKIEQIRFFEEVRLGDGLIASTDVLPEIYELQNFQPVWTDGSVIRQLLDAVRKIRDDGINPEDYHLNDLLQYHHSIQAIGQDDPWLSADFDILLTDSLIRLLYHLYFGKVDPTTLNPGWNLLRPFNYRNPARVVLEIIQSGSVESTIESLKPQYPAYRRLRAALAKYRLIQSTGGWIPISSGPVLRQGDRDPRVALIRKRLARTDEIAAENDDPEFFDEALSQAVQRFQIREEIDPDGAVDRPTLIELNYPVDGRIDQIRANLERMRWFLHDLPDQFVVVDIAGFSIDYYKKNRITWTARAQVGDPFTQTPCFKAEIKYMVLNPTWMVPPGMASREYLPKLRENPDFLKQTDLKIIDRKGKFVDPDKIKWDAYSKGAFPYKLFQEPGPTNPLGRIKFICPNPFYIYLHDTPETERFAEEWRAFSAGCIRVQRPSEFAMLLLGDQSGWDFGKLTRTIASGQTRTIFLPLKIPVMFLYVTVLAEQNGMIFFRDDIYGRDEAVIKGLEAPFEFKNVDSRIFKWRSSK